MLHEPLALGPLRLRNRIVFSAHLTNAAEDGRPTAQHAAYYAERAAGGAGLVITEEHSVHPGDRPYEKLMRGHDPGSVPGYRRITDAVHAHDVPVLAQLNHNGGQSSGMYSREAVWAPSPLPDPMFREVPKEITVAEIGEIVTGYGRTAEHCAAGGFDGVELQCSHASLLRQFLSPLTNRRTDGYGGALENRVRIVREIVDAVREAIGPRRVLGVRLCGDEGIPGGTPAAEAVETARILERAGIDHVNTSVGVATATLHLIEAPMPVPPGYALAVPAAIRRAVAVPVIGVGRFTEHAQAERALAEGHCDLVGVVRGQIADPGFAAAPGPPLRGLQPGVRGPGGPQPAARLRGEPAGGTRVGAAPAAVGEPAGAGGRGRARRAQRRGHRRRARTPGAALRARTRDGRAGGRRREGAGARRVRPRGARPARRVRPARRGDPDGRPGDSVHRGCRTARRRRAGHRVPARPPALGGRPGPRGRRP